MKRKLNGMKYLGVSIAVSDVCSKGTYASDTK